MNEIYLSLELNKYITCLLPSQAQIRSFFYAKHDAGKMLDTVLVNPYLVNNSFFL